MQNKHEPAQIMNRFKITAPNATSPVIISTCYSKLGGEEQSSTILHVFARNQNLIAAIQKAVVRSGSPGAMLDLEPKPRPEFDLTEPSAEVRFLDYTILAMVDNLRENGFGVKELLPC